MGIADELQKLEQLRQNGTLTDEEFAKAKAQLLSPPIAVSNEMTSRLESQLAEVRFQNELARIDREWEMQRQQYQIVGKYGRVYIPTIGMGIATTVVGCFFGMIWIVIALSMISAAPMMGMNVGRGSTFELIFPLVGVVFIVLAIARGIYCFLLAANYHAALAAYRRRRNQVTLGENPV